MEALRADLPRRFPRDGRDRADGGAIAPRSTDRGPAWRGALSAGQVSDDRLAVVSRHRRDLVQQPRPFGSRAQRVPCLLSREVLPYALARHGYPLPGGNRTSAFYCLPSVTIILRRRALWLPDPGRTYSSRWPSHTGARSLPSH